MECLCAFVEMSDVGPSGTASRTSSDEDEVGSGKQVEKCTRCVS